MDQDTKTAVGGCLLAVLLMPFMFCGCYGCSKIELGEGYRDGTIRKLSHTGWIWKTWECEMLGDGMRLTSDEHGTRVSPETFQYTVDPAAVEAIQAIPPAKRVRLHYRRHGAAWRPNGETAYFVTKVERLN